MITDEQLEKEYKMLDITDEEDKKIHKAYKLLGERIREQADKECEEHFKSKDWADFKIRLNKRLNEELERLNKKDKKKRK